MKTMFLYCLRWQMSTPILYVSLLWLPLNTLYATLVANLIGALLFFKIDQWIMRRKK